jgi:hypothetical protein
MNDYLEDWTDPAEWDLAEFEMTDDDGEVPF